MVWQGLLGRSAVRLGRVPGKFERAVCQMVVYHADALHKGISDDRPHESQAPLFEIPAHFPGNICFRGDIPASLPVAH